MILTILVCLVVGVVSQPPGGGPQTTTTTTTASTISVTDPHITVWTKSTGYGNSAYKSILTDVTAIYYNTSYVWISTNSVPSYTIGPTWGDDNNTVTAQNFTYLFTRTPSNNTGTKSTVRGNLTSKTKSFRFSSNLFIYF